MPLISKFENQKSTLDDNGVVIADRAGTPVKITGENFKTETSDLMNEQVTYYFYGLIGNFRPSETKGEFYLFGFTLLNNLGYDISSNDPTKGFPIYTLIDSGSGYVESEKGWMYHEFDTENSTAYIRIAFPDTTVSYERLDDTAIDIALKTYYGTLPETSDWVREADIGEGLVIRYDAMDVRNGKRYENITAIENEVLGDNIVTNPLFTSGTSWLRGSGWSIEGGVANLVVNVAEDNEYSALIQSSLIAGAPYKVTLDVSGLTNGTVNIQTELDGAVQQEITEDGSYEFYLYADSTDLVITGSADAVFEIDDIVVKQVISGDFVNDPEIWDDGIFHDIEEPETLGQGTTRLELFDLDGSIYLSSYLNKWWSMDSTPKLDFSTYSGQGEIVLLSVEKVIDRNGKEIDLDDVTLASDGKSLTISGAVKDEEYKVFGPLDASLTPVLIIKYPLASGGYTAEITHFDSIISIADDNDTYGPFEVGRDMELTLEGKTDTNEAPAIVEDASGKSADYEYTNTESESISDGIQTFTATAQNGGMYLEPNYAVSDVVFVSVKVDADSSDVELWINDGVDTSNDAHSGGGTEETLVVRHVVNASATTLEVWVRDKRASGWTAITADEYEFHNLENLGLDTLLDDTAKASAYFQSYHADTLGVGEIRARTVGKQLFNKDDATLDYKLDTDGTLVASSGDFVSDYMPVIAGEEYVGQDEEYAWYDKSLTFISYGTGSSAVTAPDTARYLRVSSAHTGIDTFMIEQANTATTYEAYRSDTAWTPEIGYRLPNGTADSMDLVTGVHTQRVSTPVAITSGTAVNTTNYPLAKNTGSFYIALDAGGGESGTIGTDSASGDGILYYELASPVTTDYDQYSSNLAYTDGQISCIPYMRKFWWMDSTPEIDLSYGETEIYYKLLKVDKVLDSDGEEVDLADVTLAGDGLSITISGALEDEKYEIFGPLDPDNSTVPQIVSEYELDTGAYSEEITTNSYVFKTADGITGTLENESIIHRQIQAVVEGSKNGLLSTRMVSTGKNLFDKTKVTSDYKLDTDGTLTSSAGDFTSDYIPVIEAENYIGQDEEYAWFDKDFAFISYGTGSSSLTAPTDALYLRVSSLTTGIDAFQIEIGTVATTYEAYVESISYFNEPPILRGLTSGAGSQVNDDNSVTYNVVEEELGDNVITNGGFGSDTGWSYEAAWEFANDRAEYDSTSDQGLWQDVGVIEGDIYKFSFDVISEGTMRMGIFDNSGNVIADYQDFVTGDYEFIFQARSSSVIKIIALTEGDAGSIGSPSIELVLDADITGDIYVTGLQDQKGTNDASQGTESYQPLIVSGYLEFDGSDDFITYANVFSDKSTWSLGFKTLATTSSIALGDDDANNRFYIDDSEISYSYDGTVISLMSLTQVVGDRIIVIYNSGTFSIYINGVEQTITQPVSYDNYTSPSIVLGAVEPVSATTFSITKLRSFSLFDTALSSAEVAYLDDILENE
jgi:hypothetical protein